MKVEIRKFNLNDLDELLEIEKFSFPKAPYDKKTFLIWYSAAKNGFFVAKVNKKLVGYVIGYKNGKKGTLVSIATHPEFRRKGVGTKLWQKLLQFFIANGVEKVDLQVRKSNLVAQKFYEKLGFEEVCIKKSYYEDGEDAISMEIILNR
jgi:ribosomal-protein-alanine N-acetyltransferase